jgi:hypothetical protein
MKSFIASIPAHRITKALLLVVASTGIATFFSACAGTEYRHHARVDRRVDRRYARYDAYNNYYGRYGGYGRYGYDYGRYGYGRYGYGYGRLGYGRFGYGGYGRFSRW